MTRLESVTQAVQAVLREHSDVISQKKDLTGILISVRLYPNGGLVRKPKVNFEMEPAQ